MVRNLSVVGNTEKPMLFPEECPWPALPTKLTYRLNQTS